MTYKDVAITAAALAASAAVLSSVGKKKRKRTGKKKKTGAKTIAFTADGETTMTLPIGGEFIVTYDATAPWVYSPQGTATTPVVEDTDGKIRFKLEGPLLPEEPDQVYVVALDQNENVMGQHKVTVFAKA